MTEAQRAVIGSEPERAQGGRDFLVGRFHARIQGEGEALLKPDREF
jgi:hypothetical protein